jgi:hypothetical protein
MVLERCVVITKLIRILQIRSKGKEIHFAGRSLIWYDG